MDSRQRFCDELKLVRKVFVRDLPTWDRISNDEFVTVEVIVRRQKPQEHHGEVFTSRLHQGPGVRHEGLIRAADPLTPVG